MTTLDLTTFCSTEPSRPNLHAPFRLGEHVFATDGRICVRVPAYEGPPEGSVDPRKFFSNIPEVTPARLRSIKSAQKQLDECTNCGGTGKMHECPNCDCGHCEFCDGAGSVDNTPKIRVALRGAVFDLRYINLIRTLPNLHLAVSAPKDAAMYFRFDGGDGVLMPMCWADGVDTVKGERAEKEAAE